MMTGRLTPTQLRDLSNFWRFWVGDKRIATMLWEEAARREAEQKPEAVSDREHQIIKWAASRTLMEIEHILPSELARVKLMLRRRSDELGQTTTAGGVVLSADSARCKPQVEREGLDSADAPLRLEAGKFYRTRDGRKVGPMERSDILNGVMAVADPFVRWRWDAASGKIFTDTNSPQDLISEWVEDKPAPAAPKVIAPHQYVEIVGGCRHKDCRIESVVPGFCPKMDCPHGMDKPAPAADDLPMLTAEQMATLKTDVASGEIERGYNVRVCVSQLIRVIEAQAREIREQNECIRAWHATAEQAEAKAARLVEENAALREQISAPTDDHTYACTFCGHAYTPAPTESEDCPKCGYDGGAALAKKEPAHE